MRWIFLGLLLLGTSTLFGQSVKVEHVLEPNTTYLWILKNYSTHEYEKIGVEGEGGLDFAYPNYNALYDSAEMQVLLHFSDKEGDKIPFEGTILKMDRSRLNWDGEEINASDSLISDVKLYGHYNSFQRIIIDTIKGTNGDDEYRRIFSSLDNAYRSMNWPKDELVFQQPIIKSSKTEMLESTETYEWVSVDEELAIIEYKKTQKGQESKPLNDFKSDKVELGRIIYDMRLSLVIEHSSSNNYKGYSELRDATIAIDSKSVNHTNWTFKRIE